MTHGELKMSKHISETVFFGYKWRLRCGENKRKYLNKITSSIAYEANACENSFSENCVTKCAMINQNAELEKCTFFDLFSSHFFRCFEDRRQSEITARILRSPIRFIFV